MLGEGPLKGLCHWPREEDSSIEDVRELMRGRVKVVVTTAAVILLDTEHLVSRSRWYDYDMKLIRQSLDPLRYQRVKVSLMR